MTGEYEARLADISAGPWREQSEGARKKLRTMTEKDADRYFRYHGDKTIEDPNEICQSMRCASMQRPSSRRCSRMLPLVDT